MRIFETFLCSFQQVVWSVPTLLLLLLTGVYLTVRLRFVSIRYFPLALRCIFAKEKGAGDISPFASLCTALAATIGTGSVVGVATALRGGGPGALFWMWITAFFGMAIKYAEGVLAVKFRQTDEKGAIVGGPMHYIEKGLGIKYKWMACLFSLFGMGTALFGSGTLPQSYTITETLQHSFNISKDLTNVILVLLVGIVIIGGISSISKVAEFLVPAMATLYVGGGSYLLYLNADKLWPSLCLIVKSAFTPYAMLGGAASATMISVLAAARLGIARSIYTNEAGLGSSAIVAAAAKSNSCVRQGLVSMTSVFFTTLVVCTLTGIVIITSNLLATSPYDGVILSSHAFCQGVLSSWGNYIVSLGITCFAFTTVIGWNYYGERCLIYLSGSTKWVLLYKLIFLACLAFGPYITSNAVWYLADITNGLMALPNLIAVLSLYSIVAKETKTYFQS